MPTSLFQYEMLPTTWFYLSSLMILATFFRFSRIFSIRNFDILCLIISTPGLLYISMGQVRLGFLWIHAAGLIFFLRLFADLFMTRRPLLEPNLALSGMIFAIVMLIVFFVPNLLLCRGDRVETPRTIRLDQLITTRALRDLRTGKPDPVMENPGYRPFYLLSRKTEEIFLPSKEIQDQIEAKLAAAARNVSVPVVLHGSQIGPFIHGAMSAKFSAFLGGETPSAAPVPAEPERVAALPAEPNGRMTVEDYNRTHAALSEEDLNRTPALDEFFLISFILLAQFGVVWGLVAVGHCHFGNLKMGFAAAMVYLLLPYVNQMPGSLENVVPGMLLVMAVAIYRRPFFSGFLIGMAACLVFYPFFLIPLWCGFYLKRGFRRFLVGTFSAVMLMGLLLMFSPADYGPYSEQLASMFGLHSMCLTVPAGIWAFLPVYYRIPIIAAYLVICFGLCLWPPQKNLATLIACSALLMLGVQFWMGNLGGLYMGWYLPLLLLTFFRPNLEDRVAQTTVIEI